MLREQLQQMTSTAHPSICAAPWTRQRALKKHHLH